MSDFLEAVVTLLPREAGGRLRSISPREGSYSPFARHTDGGPTLRLRFIEGPPTLAPGATGRVVLEIETSIADHAWLAAGAELQLFESSESQSVIGLVMVTRLWRRAG